MTASWPEKLYLGYIGVGGVLVGIANFTLPMAVLHSAVQSRGGASIPKLFDTTIYNLEVAESAANAPPNAASESLSIATNTAAGSVSTVASSVVNPSLNMSKALASDRLVNARENLDTLAALVATTLFHIQYSVGGDALTSFLALHALRPSTTHGERRLVHRALGVLKVAQYTVHLMHESLSAEGIEFGVATFLNLIGLGISTTASYVWGWSSQ